MMLQLWNALKTKLNQAWEIVKTNLLHNWFYASVAVASIVLSLVIGVQHTVAFVGTFALVFALYAGASVLANHSVYSFTNLKLDPAKELSLPWAILLGSIYVGTMVFVLGLSAFIYFTFFQ